MSFERDGVPLGSVRQESCRKRGNWDLERISSGLRTGQEEVFSETVDKTEGILVGNRLDVRSSWVANGMR